MLCLLAERCLAVGLRLWPANLTFSPCAQEPSSHKNSSSNNNNNNNNIIVCCCCCRRRRRRRRRIYRDHDIIIINGTKFQTQLYWRWLFIRGTLLYSQISLRASLAS